MRGHETPASSVANNESPSPARRYIQLARHFAARDLRERFLGSLSGGLWAVAQPVIQLLVLFFVFGTLLKVRLPGADPQAFLPFLAAGLWPWVAFSEAAVRGMNAIPERAALMSKVALPRTVLVLAPVLSSFALHGVGFIAVLLVIAAMGHAVTLGGLAIGVLYWLVLGACAFGFALGLATLNVFVRDTAQIVPQLFMLWFYLTPIFYPLAIIPERIRPIAEANPLTAFVTAFRSSLVAEPADPVRLLAVMALATAVALGVGSYMFRRASRHFEDFL